MVLLQGGGKAGLADRQGGAAGCVPCAGEAGALAKKKKRGGGA